MKTFKFITKYWLWFLTGIILIAVVVSSIEIYREEILKIDPDVEYEEQNNLNIPSQRIDTLNPIISQSRDVYYLSKLIYDSLFDYDENLKIKKGLVKEFTVDKEKACIELTLRENVKWHDNSILTANDVVFTVNSIKIAGVKSPYYDMVKKIHSCYSRGENMVMIYFRDNRNCSLDDLTFPIVSGKNFLSPRAMVYAKEEFIPIGTGRYKYKDYDPHKMMRLIPNKSYFGEKARNKINVIMLPEKSLATNMMDIKEVTCYTDDNPDRKAEAKDKGYKIFDIPSNNVDFLVFNTWRMYTKTEKFRQALAYAIDSQKILDNSYMGDGVLTDTLYYPNFLGVRDTEITQQFNQDKAKKFFSELGYEDKNDDGKLEDSSGKIIALTILVQRSNAMRNSAAKLIKKQLSQVGISSDIVSTNKKEYESKVKKKEFDILITGYSMTPDYDLRDFFNGKNPWNYSDYATGKYVAEMERLQTVKEYRTCYRTIKKVMSKSRVYYPICYKNMSLIGVDTFEATKLPSFTNRYRGCHTWSWSEEKIKSEKALEKKNEEKI